MNRENPISARSRDGGTYITRHWEQQTAGNHKRPVARERTLVRLYRVCLQALLAPRPAACRREDVKYRRPARQRGADSKDQDRPLGANSTHLKRLRDRAAAIAAARTSAPSTPRIGPAAWPVYTQQTHTHTAPRPIRTGRVSPANRGLPRHITRSRVYRMHLATIAALTLKVRVGHRTNCKIATIGGASRRVLECMLGYARGSLPVGQERATTDGRARSTYRVRASDSSRSEHISRVICLSCTHQKATLQLT
jgi:hypothetical protein